MNKSDGKHHEEIFILISEIYLNCMNELPKQLKKIQNIGTEYAKACLFISL